jgi:hypothetical protein
MTMFCCLNHNPHGVALLAELGTVPSVYNVTLERQGMPHGRRQPAPVAPSIAVSQAVRAGAEHNTTAAPGKPSRYQQIQLQIPLQI